MNTIIIVRIRDGYQPPEGTAFDAVVSALNHFEIESVVSKAEGDELVAAAEALRHQVEQMRGMFGDEDGTIAAACKAFDDLMEAR